MREENGYRVKNKIHGIIFDMDNTLLSSKINFTAMKKETYEFVTNKGILPKSLDLAKETTSVIIEKAIKTGKMDKNLIDIVWEIPKKHEIAGMKGAILEPGVPSLLEKLHGKIHLVVVTNNSIEAANRALKENDVYNYFDIIVGREILGSLKPSPEGFLYVLNYYKTISPEEWLSVGDAWLDGKASLAAGIKFISYKGDIQKMNNVGVYPYGKIKDISELLKFI